MHTNLIAAPTELGQNIGGQHPGVAAGHIDIQIGQGIQIVECVIEGDFLSGGIVGIRNFVGHLNLIDKEIVWI